MSRCEKHRTWGHNFLSGYKAPKELFYGWHLISLIIYGDRQTDSASHGDGMAASAKTSHGDGMAASAKT